MIFSRFFAPSHNSNDPDIRLKAIDRLSPDSQNEKRILHELAFNDDDERVSLAALEKLDAFALWLKMSQIARNPKLRSAAQARVECALIDGSQQLSLKEVKEYLLKSAPADQIVRCLPLMTELHEDADFIVRAISRVGRSAFYFDMMTKSPSVTLKQVLIDSCDDLDLLLKALKKARDSETESRLVSRIEDLKIEAQKPVDLSRDCTLTLSKMQALLDKADYPSVNEQFDALRDEYSRMASEFSCLDVTVRQAFEEKFTLISDKLERHLARLETPWRDAQRAEAHKQAKQRVTDTVQHVKEYHQKLQGEQLLSLSLGEVSDFQKAVESAEAAIEILQGFESTAEEIETMLEDYRHIWDGLPTLQRQVGELQANLKQWRSDAECIGEDTASFDVEKVTLAWRQATSEMTVVPGFLKTEWKALNKLLSTHKDKQRAQQQSDLKQCRKFINIIENLITQGKYKAAMQRFAKLTEMYQMLPANTQGLVQKRYQQTEAEIARLEGWQSYIAAPRKPQLIEQAKGLIVSKGEDMPAKAKAVKVLRQQWLSLGSTGSDEDELLNKQFDALLEEAFEPCRAYYAELEIAQNKAAQAREKLINALTELSNDETEPTSRYQQFEQLKKQWQQAPQTDAERYSTLRAKWDALSEQVNALLAPWIQSNRESKEALLKEAEALRDADDIIEASEQAKALQQQWKQTGPAGKRVESKLWFAFKAANDEIFSKAKSQQQQTRNIQRTALQNWQQSLEKLKAEVESSPGSEQQLTLNSLNEDLAALSTNPKERKSLSLQLHQVQLTLSEALATQQHEALIRQVESVVSALSEPNPIDTAEFNTLAPDLPQSWWKGERSDSETTVQHNLLMLEVLAQLPSPVDTESARSTVQLQLMQRKLSGESLPDIDGIIGVIIASVGHVEELQGDAAKQRLHDILCYYALPEVGE